jgi:hypothetical protein
VTVQHRVCHPCGEASDRRRSSSRPFDVGKHDGEYAGIVNHVTNFRPDEVASFTCRGSNLSYKRAEQRQSIAAHLCLGKPASSVERQSSFYPRGSGPGHCRRPLDRAQYGDIFTPEQQPRWPGLRGSARRKTGDSHALAVVPAFDTCPQCRWWTRRSLTLASPHRGGPPPRRPRPHPHPQPP